MNSKRIKTISFLCALCVLISCSKSKTSEQGIAVSILPQKYLVERIAGKTYNVTVIVPPGHSPESYDPTFKQLKDISSAFIYFRIGHIPFELSQLNKIASVNPAMQIVDTSAGIELLHGTHDDHSHHHTGVDPHIWLSPKNARIMAANMFEALKVHDPIHTKTFEKNFNELDADIASADRKISASLNELKGKTFLCFHPAWSYFARDYGLKQISIETDGKEPTPADIKKILAEAKKHNIKAIFIQKEFSAEIAQSIATEINAKVVQLDPLAEDLIATMNTICETFQKEIE